MKIGLFGGSFNPIHNGHIEIIESLLEKKLVDEVWALPCRKHAFNKELRKEEDRVSMIKLAIQNIPNTRLCDVELKSKEKSYSYLTLRKLEETYSHHFYWIIGSDILDEIKRWYGYDNLKKEAEFIVFQRENHAVKNPGIKIAYTLDGISSISSTKIRNLAKEGKSLKNLIPLPIQDYITKKGLYK